MSNTNTIEDLRNELFSSLRALNDKSNPMEIERAKAVADIGQVIINTAKVEVEFMRATGATGTGFIPALGVHGKPAVTPTPTGVKSTLNGVTVHKLKG